MLKWLEEWYKSQCDGEWEHYYGINIYNCDNPGWCVDINISDTPIERKEINSFNYNKGDNDWIICQVKEGQFRGSGDPSKLEEIIKIFKEWVEQ